MKKVALIISHQGFQPKEYGEPKRILQEAGFKVVTVSNNPGSATSSIIEEKVDVDLVLDSVDVNEFDGIFFIGGPGALANLDNESSYRIAREALKKDIYFGAICISPRILAHAGVLQGKKATGWNDDHALEDLLPSAGGEYVAENVVTDGKIITASGPKAAEEFGEKIVELMG